MKAIPLDLGLWEIIAF